MCPSLISKIYNKYHNNVGKLENKKEKNCTAWGFGLQVALTSPINLYSKSDQQLWVKRGQNWFFTYYSSSTNFSKKILKRKLFLIKFYTFFLPINHFFKYLHYRNGDIVGQNKALFLRHENCSECHIIVNDSHLSEKFFEYKSSV